MSFELSREDLWENKIGKIDDLDVRIYEKLDEFKLKIKHAYSLYNIIGEEDEKEIENELQKKREEEARKKELENKKLLGIDNSKKRRKKL